jgi:hypothetical protein
MESKKNPYHSPKTDARQSITSRVVCRRRRRLRSLQRKGACRQRIQQLLLFLSRDIAAYDQPEGQSAEGRRVGSRAARKSPIAQELQNELNDLFAAASQQGQRFVDVISDDLASRATTHPSNHAIRTCLWLMRKNVRSRDIILRMETSGTRSVLTIRYKLPR